jgi:hypothetical protein
VVLPLCIAAVVPALAVRTWVVDPVAAVALWPKAAVAVPELTLAAISTAQGRRVISVVATPKPSIATVTRATTTMATAIVALLSGTMTAITTSTTVVAIAFSGMVSGSGLYGPDYYSYNDCWWLRERALATGNPYWWSRYNNCVGYY